MIRGVGKPSFRDRVHTALQKLERPGMMIKLAVLGVALVIVWLVMFRTVRGPVGERRKPPKLKAQALEPCPKCGVYRLPGGACDCDT